MLAAKRTVPHVGLFAALLGVTLLLSGLSVGLAGYLATASTAGAQAGIDALRGREGAFRISEPADSDPAAQDDRVRAAISALRADGRPLPTLVSRDVVTTDSVTLQSATSLLVNEARTPDIALASIPDLEQRAELVDGAWPRDAAQVSIQADAARSLRLSVGDQLGLPDGTRVTVSGTWHVQDPGDPRWLDERAVLTGTGASGHAGYLVIDPSLWAQLDLTGDLAPIARWTVEPDAARITAPQLGALRAAAAKVTTRLQQTGDGEVSKIDRLSVAVPAIEQNVTASAAVATTPLIVVGVLGLITLLGLGRMLEQLRGPENALLRARGATSRRLVLWTAAETAAAAVPGALVGAVLGEVVLRVAGADADVPAVGWIGVAAAVIAAVAVLAATAGSTSREARRSGRRLITMGAVTRSRIELGAAALVVLLAVVSVSQFMIYGTPLLPAAGGGVAVDPLAVSAPAVAIAAAGLMLVALFPLAARGLERGGARARGIGSLPLRQLARRSRPAITSILVLSYAVGTLVFAATYSGSWSEGASETRAVRVGTDIRIVPLDELATETTSAFPGQLAAAPAAVVGVQVGDDRTSVIGLPADRLAEVVNPASGIVDPGRLASELSVPVDRPSLPVDATGISLQIAANPVSAAPDGAQVDIVDAVGTARALTLSATAGGFASPLPADGVAPWTLRAVTLTLPVMESGDEVSCVLSATDGTTSTPVQLDSTWTSVAGPGESPLLGQNLEELADRDPAGFRIRAALSVVGGRVIVQPVPAAGTLLPVVLARDIAGPSGLDVGAKFDLTAVSFGLIPAQVVGIDAVTPGTGNGVITDLGALQDAALRAGLTPISATEWWIATDDLAATSAAIVEQTPPGTELVTRSPRSADQVLGSARVAIWVAAAAAALLALVTVAAGLTTEIRARAGEVGALRAMGLLPRAQGRQRAVEWGAMLLLGVLAGLIDGLVVSALMAAPLARVAVPNAIASLLTPFRIDLPVGLAAVVILAVVLAVLLSMTAAVVRRQASAATREEVR